MRSGPKVRSRLIVYSGTNVQSNSYARSQYVIYAQWTVHIRLSAQFSVGWLRAEEERFKCAQEEKKSKVELEKRFSIA